MPQLITAPSGMPPAVLAGTPALRSALTRALESVLDTSSLLFVQLSCPTLLTEPVTAQSRTTTPGHQPAAQVPGPMYVRQMALPQIGRVEGATLVVASRDQQAVDQAGSFPPLTAMIIDRELERQNAEQAAHVAVHLANMDPATSLGNRRAWINTLAVEGARASRTGQPLCVLVLDLDGLKIVNDTEGHAAGDQLIASTAACLSGTRRATDVVCRLGGDEFGIAAPATDDLQARLLAARIRAALHDKGVAVSIGWAVGSATGNAGPDVEQLWRHADELMYQDKRTRR